MALKLDADESLLHFEFKTVYLSNHIKPSSFKWLQMYLTITDDVNVQIGVWFMLMMFAFSVTQKQKRPPNFG